MKIVISTTFREFDGNQNDKMQLGFLKSLKRQTFQDYVLVATIFGEHNVEGIIRKILGNHCVFFYDAMEGNYKFSLSKTFKNGVDYGLSHDAEILLDCSSDVILQNNFLETIARNCSRMGAGISHPNIFKINTEDGKSAYSIGDIDRGIDARFFSLDIFKKENVYSLLEKYPSYDYGAGIENFLCGIAIKYGKNLKNIFMESKVLKIENDRDVAGRKTSFMRQGFARNYPTVKKFLINEGLGESMVELENVHRKYKITKNKAAYWILVGKQYITLSLIRRNRL